MEFQSIIFGGYEMKLKKEAPDFFKDLHLDYLVERILEHTKGYKTYPYFYTFPRSEELIIYRQQICRDMESEELCTVVQNFCRSLKESEKIHNLSLESKTSRLSSVLPGSPSATATCAAGSTAGSHDPITPSVFSSSAMRIS